MALVTSLRDGMNLVSMEYVACQKEHCGVLVLSELAGAAQVCGCVRRAAADSWAAGARRGGDPRESV